MSETPFKRLLLRSVLREVYPMVIRLVAVPDYLELGDFDDAFHAVLGWDGGIGYVFQVQGQQFNSFRRRTRAKRLRDFGFHGQEKFLYTLGAMDQWEWDVRVFGVNYKMRSQPWRESATGAVTECRKHSAECGLSYSRRIRGCGRCLQQ